MDSLKAPVVGLRYFNVYGPHEQHKGRMASVAFHQYFQFKKTGKVKLFEGCQGYANGAQMRDFVYVEDVVNVGAAQGETFEQMLRIGPNDVLIAISFPRYSQRTLKAVHYAKKQGACIIGITDSTSAPLAAMANHVLLARSEMASFVDSLVAPMSLLNAIIVAVGLRKKHETSNTYAMLERIWSEYDVYEKNEEIHSAP